MSGEIEDIINVMCPKCRDDTMLMLFHGTLSVQQFIDCKCGYFHMGGFQLK